MKKIAFIILGVSLLAAACNSRTAVNPTPTPVVTPGPTPTQTPNPNPTPAPIPTPTPSALKIISLRPTSGPIGTSITITGSNFTSTGNIVHFGLATNDIDAIGTIYPNISSSKNTVVFLVPAKDNPMCPASAPLCPIRAANPTYPGTYNLFISNANGTSNILTFTVSQ